MAYFIRKIFEHGVLMMATYEQMHTGLLSKVIFTKDAHRA
jgi:hypothetical protein